MALKRKHQYTGINNIPPKNMNTTNSWMSKTISTEISCNGPSQSSSISVTFLKLKLNCIKIVHLSLSIKTAIKDTINPWQLFIFTNVIRCSRLPLWVGYFIYFKFTSVSSIVYQSLQLYYGGQALHSRFWNWK